MGFMVCWNRCMSRFCGVTAHHDSAADARWAGDAAGDTHPARGFVGRDLSRRLRRGGINPALLLSMLIALLFGSLSCNPPAQPDKPAPVPVPAPVPAPAPAPSAPVPTADATSQASPLATVTTAPVEYECRWTDIPMTIDGKADESAWQHAQVLDHFRIPVTGTVPHTPTKARVLWDREYFYFFAEMEDADLFADVTEHNGTIWLNDVFEIFFKPAADKPGYYEFEVNAANADMELFLPMRNAGGYTRFKNTTSIEMKTAVQLRGTLNEWHDKDQGWSVEGRIRWRDFAPTGGRPNPDEQWKFNLCRYDYSVAIDGPDLSCVAPLKEKNYHHFEDFVPLRFVGPTVATTGKPFGIESRPLWTKSRVVGSPDPSLPYTITRAFPKWNVFQPVYMCEEPGTDNLLVVQHLGHWTGPGKVFRVRNDPNVDSAEVILEQDRLIYGLTFHPDFVHNGYVYLLSNGPVDAPNKQNRICRYTIDRKPPYRLDPASEGVILEWDSNGHNGGELAFGPDGYLYHASGDGSSDSDANLRGQDMAHLNSKMIRIDVDHPDPGKHYSVPKDNPFVGLEGIRPETWAYGFRNPWRIAFDKKSGALWVGQNGQDLWEQVYICRKGENYGWSAQEGAHPFYPERIGGPVRTITPPIIEHPHSEARSLTGGIVYYGNKFPDLNGAYIYGDFGTGRVWAAKYEWSKIVDHRELARTTLQIVQFYADKHGDLFVLDDLGEIYKFQPAPPPATQPLPFPTKLSQTGLFADTRTNSPNPGLIPYDVNAPLWSDGAAKERFIALPGDSNIELTAARGWNFSDGAVLVKTFSLQSKAGDPSSLKRVETRLLTRQTGQWYGYTYKWDDAQNDATLVGAAGEDRPFMIRDPKVLGGLRVQTWHYPSRAECMMCHTRAANFVLGLSTLQMNKERDYHGVRDNQLRVLEHLGVLKVDLVAFTREGIKREIQRTWGMKGPELAKMVDARMGQASQRQAVPSSLLPMAPKDLPALVDPSDAAKDVRVRARSYLHANCANCHVNSGGGNAQIDLEFTTPLAAMKLVDVPPNHGTQGIDNGRLVVPGDPDHSVLLKRMAIRGNGQMPPLGTRYVDDQAVALIREWITEVKPEENKSEARIPKSESNPKSE